MKKILFVTATAITCFLMACTDSTSKTASSTDNSMNDKNLENNRKVMKAIENGDAATIDSLIASDAVDHMGPTGDVKGGDSVKHMLVDMHNHVKDLKFDVIADAANGDYIFTLSHMTGTMNDASWGMPAGTKMDEKGVDVVKVKDGKMVEHWGFADPAEMMKHMQSMPMNNNPANNKMMDNKMDTTKKM